MFELVEESLSQNPEPLKTAPPVTPMPSAAQTEGVIYTMPEKFLNQPKTGLPLPFIVGGSVGVLIILAGLGTAVFLSSREPAPVAEAPVQIVETPVEPAPVEPAPEPTPEPTPVEPVTPAPIEPVTPAPIAPVVLVNASDVDADGLSDVEEVLYGTDLNKPDSDNDGYSDGSEVRFLFDPMKATSGQLGSSTKMARYRQSTMPQFSFIHPVTWDVRVGINAQQLTVSTGNDESILIDTIETQSLTDLTTWLTQNVPQFVAGTTSLKTGTAWVGYMNEGGTEGYLVKKNGAGVLIPYVFHVKYVGGAQNEISFRATFDMIVASMTAAQ